MFKSGSTKLVRNLNRKHVLNLVRMNPGITARKISNETGLQFSTVKYTLHTLQEKGLICENGYGSSTLQGGKPPVLWAVNPDYGYIIGMELLSKEIRLIVTEFDSAIALKKTIPLQTGNNIDATVSFITKNIDEILMESRFHCIPVLGLGVGLPGSVNHETGVIQFSYSLGKKIDFAKKLQNHFSFPMQIDNDANTGALGMKWLSPDEHWKKHLIYVSIQQDFSGMGIGFIINHEIYRGSNSAAGEIASFLPKTVLKNILKKARSKNPGQCFICDAAELNHGSLPAVSEIIRQAQHGDASAQFVLREIAKEISKALINLINLFNPEIIVIGGDICEAKKYIEPVIQERIKANVISDAARNTALKFSSFGAYSVAMGGTALVLQRIFNS